MKLKQAVIFGILIWAITYLLSPLFNMFNVQIINPIITIICTGFFGILYIRNFNNNEAVEGILVGIVFIIISLILDFAQFYLTNSKNTLLTNYPLYFFTKIILTLLITTLLGYLAQMNIELK